MIAAVKACQAQGLKPKTDAFKQCLKSQLGLGDGSKAGTGPVAKLVAAAKACQAQGLKPKTDAFKQCLKAQLSGTALALPRSAAVA